MCDSHQPLNGVDSQPLVVKVQRQSDALGAICRDCDSVFNITTCPYWHWSKSKWMHEQGSGHKLDLYTFAGVQ